ncbi:MAG: ATP-binding protein, partial [Microbacteriaceae bacterium]
MQAIADWWNSISLRTKVTGVTVLMLTLGLLISGIGTSALLRNYLVDQIDSRLRNASQDWQSILGPGASPDNEECVSFSSTEYFWAIYTADGALFCENWANRPAATRPAIESLSYEETEALRGSIFSVNSSVESTGWRLISIPLQSQIGNSTYSLVIGLSLMRTEDTMNNYISIFFGFGLIVVLFAAGLTRFLVTNTFTPLQEVEQTAAQIAKGDFSLRLQHLNPNTEVGRLNNSLNTMLHRIDRALDDRARTIDQMRRFVGDAGHELRTPLVTVRGYAELYKMGAIEGEEQIFQAMDRIEKEAIRMAGLVEDLLELARLDQARPMEQVPLNLIPLVMDAAMDARAREPERTVMTVIPSGFNATLPEHLQLSDSQEQPRFDANAKEPPTATTVIPVISEDEARENRNRRARNRTGQNPHNRTGNFTGPIAIAGAAFDMLRRKPRRDGAISTPDVGIALPKPKAQLRDPIILGDENKLRQVITNLLTNALRFTPVDKPIELMVEVLEDRDQVRLSVIDHGEGIPPQIREKIFQRFWRADTSRTRETGGSGLGLAIVSAIVAAHNGRVWA